MGLELTFADNCFQGIFMIYVCKENRLAVSSTVYTVKKKKSVLFSQFDKQDRPLHPEMGCTQSLRWNTKIFELFAAWLGRKVYTGLLVFGIFNELWKIRLCKSSLERLGI